MLVLFGALYAWRISGLLEVPPVSDHLSNAYLSGAAVTLAGGPGAFAGATGPRRRALGAAALLLAVNVGLEVLAGAVGVDDELNRALGDVNTSDPADAVAGSLAIAGVLALLPPGSRATPAEPDEAERS